MLPRFWFSMKDTTHQNKVETSVFCVKFSSESDSGMVLPKKGHHVVPESHLRMKIGVFGGFFQFFRLLRSKIKNIQKDS